MKPTGPCFDGEWKASCTVERVNRRVVDDMMKAHYIGKWPAQVSLTLGLCRKGKVLGVVTFSEVRREVSERFGIQTWELSRLWIQEKIPQNAESFLIGRAIRVVKREHKGIERLISFADPEYGHSGVVYKATNWKEVPHSSKNLFVYELRG
jgi:hypothetical protein